jgi:hypothetical protein
VKPLEYAKAIAGAVVAGLGSLYLALDNDVVTAQEWVGIASLTLATFIGVWGVPNAAPTNLVSKKTVTVTSTDVPGPDHRADVNGL